MKEEKSGPSGENIVMSLPAWRDGVDCKEPAASRVIFRSVCGGYTS